MASRLRIWLASPGISLAISLASFVLLGATSADGQVTVTAQMEQGGASGQLVSLDSDQFKILSAESPRNLPVAEISRIDFSPDNWKTVPDSKYKVALHDGTSINASGLQTSGQTLAVKVGKTVVQIPVKAIRAVQLGELTSDQQDDWTKILDAEISADVLAIRRPSGRLEKIEGIILEIKRDALKFDFSGQQIDVPIDKLAGYRNFSAQVDRGDDATIVVTDTFGGSWRCTSTSIAPEANDLALTLAAGSTTSLPLAVVTSIDFSIGRSLPLTTPEKSRIDVQFSTRTPQLTWLKKAVDEPELLSPFIAVYQKPDTNVSKPAIHIPGGGRVACRVPSGFQDFSTTFMLKRMGSVLSPVSVEIAIDKATVLSFELNGETSVRETRIEIAADQLLEIQVESKTTLPLGAAVLLIEPKLLK